MCVQHMFVCVCVCVSIMLLNTIDTTKNPVRYLFWNIHVQDSFTVCKCDKIGASVCTCMCT